MIGGLEPSFEAVARVNRSPSARPLKDPAPFPFCRYPSPSIILSHLDTLFCVCGYSIPLAPWD